MKMHIGISCSLVTLLLVMIWLSCNMSRVWATTQQLEVWRQQKRLNKPAIKSIKSPDGDIIDCVHISHQPAFDHPLLKNHTIQMRPSFYPLGLYDENKVASKMEPSSVPQLWHQNGRCPEDTIPIRRTKKDDVVRAASAERYGKKRHKTIPNPTSAHPNRDDVGYEHALLFVTRDKYYGAKGTINVWNPTIQEQDEYSASQLWVRGGPPESLNTIEAGWHVNPSVYGDDRTRLFTFWTADNYASIGCYNLRCPGFVQVNKEIALGATIYPISSYDGPQYEITILIWQDPYSANWWLQYGNRSALGYWPSSLFPHLRDGASGILWGGEILNLNVSGQHTSTEMGSGHFAGGKFRRASFFKNIRIVDHSNKYQTPRGDQILMPQKLCYDLEWDGGDSFYYGGPGFNRECP
ncbi:protein neprosin-like [Elaeis guineensis]|uniref:Uncharacterized protein LOC105046491 n=1 Tax=Elaeis guineensis var. tenera TaxID=51953 RepID=A0A6I9RAL3_ELAGV|nr:uncharacterized protein LOC105046491 [Elaeis guineensis]